MKERAGRGSTVHARAVFKRWVHAAQGPADQEIRKRGVGEPSDEDDASSAMQVHKIVRQAKETGDEIDQSPLRRAKP